MNELMESHGESSFGPQALDRLVDGELSESQRREVLGSADHRPEGWRQIALAFLEAQCWGQTMRQMARDPASMTPAADVKPAADANSPPEQTATQQAATQLATSQHAAGLSVRSSAAGARRNRNWTRFIAMAASFLITFSLGMMLQQAWRASDPNASVVMPAGTNAVVAEAGMGAKVATMQFPEPNGGSRSVELPLVEEASAMGLPRPQAQMPAIPDAVRQALAQAGEQIRVTREYHLVKTPDGRLALVAVNRIDLVPAGNQGEQ